MISWAVLQLVLVAMTLLLVSLGVATSMQRTLRIRRGRRKLSAEARLRPLVMRVLADEEPEALELANMSRRDKAAFESLVWPMLTKVRGTTRQVLVQQLHATGAIARARQQISSRSKVTRAIAAEQLGAAGIAEASSEIAVLLNDPIREVRIVAARSLGKLGDVTVVPDLLKAMKGHSAVPPGIVAMSLVHMGPGAVDQLQIALDDDSALVRSISAQLLGMHGAINATDALVALLESDQEESVRSSAAEALGRIASPNGLDALMVATSTQNPVSVRAAAARGLGLVGGQRAVAVLSSVVDDSSEIVGAAAAAALTLAGSDGEEALAILAGGIGLGAERACEWMTRSRIANSARRHRRRFGANEQAAVRS